MSTQTSDLQSNLTLYAFSFGCGSIDLDATAIVKSGNVKIIWRAQRSPRFSNKQHKKLFLCHENHNLLSARLSAIPRPVCVSACRS